MSKEKSFAIGCFNFGVKKKIPFEFKGSDYLKELDKNLHKIANLTNLSIESDNEFVDYKETVTKKTINIENDRGFFPNALILNIEFNLHIPFKTQAKLKGSKKKYLRTFTENFNVRILSDYYAPVAIIECLKPQQKCDPSNAVQIVREYLENELNEINSDYIRFETLGPSPFHLDCFLKPRKPHQSNEWFFQTEENILKGYDELIIYYNSDEFKNADEAMLVLNDSIIDELGFYYFSQQDRVYKIHAWYSLQKKLNKLLKIQKAKGAEGLYCRFFKRQKLIGKLFVDIATFEVESTYGNNFKQNSYKQTFIAEDETFFKTFIDKSLDEKDEYPIKQVTELISFFESRRVKSVELTMTIIAALIGGAIGSIITIYLQ